jgi:hypothetical protein
MSCIMKKQLLPVNYARGDLNTLLLVKNYDILDVY